ncbi:MAG: sodium/proline symporter [Planctomycetota bacterium]|nr:MAG: sodium/proline symporter [Planctomycetota bacterium]
MEGTAALVATLVAYQLLLLGIGAWAAGRTRDQADFFLGGRGLGAWVASLSAAASSSSAWTLLGVSGAAFERGLSAVWILPACLGGFALNWFLVAERLRRESAGGGAVTLTEFLAEGAVGSARRRIVRSASAVVLLSLGTYVASQFKAAGVTFGESLGLDPAPAILVGAGIVLLYTLSGGFWAVSVTDLVQGLVMVGAAVLVPVAALVAAGGPAGVAAGLERAGPEFADLFRGAGGPAALGLVIGYLGIGLGYPGQPHVVNRFMALRGPAEVRRGTWISLVWALLIYSGMLVAGWSGRALVTELGDHEAVLLRLTHDLFPPAVAGLIVAAVLSAIMSTADSQLLVCGSAVAYDLAGADAGDRIRTSRLTVLAIGLAAVAAALGIEQTIFSSVLFAWSGLGAAFGPLLLVRLWRGPVRPGFVLAAIWTGFLVTIYWFFTPALKGRLYELVPAFAAAGLVALLGSRPRPHSARSASTGA